MPGCADKTSTSMLKLTYVTKQIFVESRVVFHVIAISLDVMLSQQKLFAAVLYLVPSPCAMKSFINY